MIAIFVVNGFLALTALLLSNDFLKWNSFLFYGAQLLTFVPYLLYRFKFVHYLLLPSFFMLFYFLVNLVFGSYLAPREFGWNKAFMYELMMVENYNLIVSYIMLSNLALFWLCCIALKKMHSIVRVDSIENVCSVKKNIVIRSLLFAAVFGLVSIFWGFGKFAIQMALVIAHLSDKSMQKSRLRIFVYAFYLIMMLVFNYESKREIILILLVMLLIESVCRDIHFKFKLGSIFAFGALGVIFFVFILAASILRGYGGFESGSFIDAIAYIPSYMGSDGFIDGLTDNLEVSYNYAAAVIPIDYVLNGRIDYQYGLTLIKVLFMPIPREIFPMKPDSIIMIFTREYDPALWSVGGSYPVVFSSEIFLNFHFFGLPVFIGVIYFINSFFMGLLSSKFGSFAFCCYVYLVVMFFILVRGSGLELYVLNFFLSLLIFVPLGIYSKSLRLKW